jgi:hypothetical protein
MTASGTSRPAGRTPRQVAGPAVERSAADPDPELESPDQPDREADSVAGAEEAPAGGSDPDPVAEPASVQDPDPVAEPASASDPDPDPMPEPSVQDPDPAAEPASVSEPDPEAEPALEPVPAAEPESRAGRPDQFMGDTGELRERWEAVQASFVDDPQRAVERADEMVSLAVAALQAHVEQRREDLAETWRGGGQASTDTLRTAFQSYRELFEGVLST